MNRKNVPLTVKLRLVSANSGRPVPGCEVSLWHCDRESRGRQTSDPAGWVTFPSAFPGEFDGHWPHVHFEVFRDAGPVHAAQLALPGDERHTMTLTSDTCFTSGWSLEIPSVTGDEHRGLVATRTVGL
jgi:protocatechuate 3,4-dioxygenase beta subunit